MKRSVPTVGATDVDYFDKIAGVKAKGSNVIQPNLVMQKNGVPVVGDMPNSTHDRKKVFEFDFGKCHHDPLEERPGYFKEWNEEYEFHKQQSQGMRNNVVKFQNNNQSYDVCTFGKMQTPINLNTSLKVLQDYKDDCFNVKYKNIDASRQIMYKEAGQQYQVVFEGKPEENVMTTSTIGLFDRHIPQANLHGLQAHFHAPSEHAIDGKLLDLEMHIVHAVEPQYVSGEASKKSQFTNGVLGFFFKAVKDDWFANNGVDDFHDQWLNTMLTSKNRTNLDLTKFVKMLNYNKRWTYQGSLTTTPFSEGILWNVIEQVIPIRQSTLDKFLEYKKIEKSKVFAPFPNEAAKKEAEELRANEPNNIKPYTDNRGDTFFRFAICNRVLQDQGNRPVYLIDTKKKAGQKFWACPFGC